MKDETELNTVITQRNVSGSGSETGNKSQQDEDVESSRELSRSDEESFNHPSTTRKELWSYYLYFNSNNGVGIWSYSATLFQLALTNDGWDPAITPVKKGSCTQGSCVIAWGSGTQSVASVVLIATGLTFFINSVVFLGFSSACDYGTLGYRLLLIFTIIQWGAQFGMVSVRQADQWPIAMVFFILSYAAYGSTLVFYNAMFPRLARFMAHVRKAREQDLKDGNISVAEYDHIESMERNHISNISTAHGNIGAVLALILSLVVFLPLQGNPFGNNLTILVTNIYGIALGVWWFVFQQRRPGPNLPKGSSYATIGWKQLVVVLREIKHLPQTFAYLASTFLLADGIATTATLVLIIQASVIEFSFLKITYIGLVQAIASTISTFGLWYFQKYFDIKTKRMFQFTNLFSCIIPLYGILGLWTDNVGFHRERDFWLYAGVFGFFQAPYYAYNQTMLSELIPKGYEFLFFGLFGITNRVSSIIGPVVVQAIANATDNPWMGFPFLFAICVLATIIVSFVNVDEGRKDAQKYCEARSVANVVPSSWATTSEMS